MTPDKLVYELYELTEEVPQRYALGTIRLALQTLLHSFSASLIGG
jgi:hypothetical protein